MSSTADPNIRFDDAGVCNYWWEAKAQWDEVQLEEDESKKRLDALFAGVRQAGKGAEYDCILGVSGGVDSSYLACLARQYELRPLVIHFDNGWNSELAVANIQKIVEGLGFDLMTYVIDWREFRDLQRAYFKADVIDIEALTDHAIFGALFQLARKHRIRVILDGTNVATESFMPRAWTWNKQDLRNIKAIHARHGEAPLVTYPTMSNLRKALLGRFVHRVRFVAPLDLCNYRKDKAIAHLESELGWRYYGGKHYESIFTRFYQAHVLPTKFNVDKRRVHLSSLILNGEMTRAEALEELEKPLYDPAKLDHDIDYICKKLGMARAEMDDYLQRPPVPHDAFATDRRTVDLILAVKRVLRPVLRF